MNTKLILAGFIIFLIGSVLIIPTIIIGMASSSLDSENDSATENNSSLIYSSRVNLTLTIMMIIGILLMILGLLNFLNSTKKYARYSKIINSK